MTILWRVLTKNQRFCGSIDEKHPGQVGAYGTASWVIFGRPYGTGFKSGALVPDTSFPPTNNPHRRMNPGGTA